ncbi:MAG: SPOR domain-containing protein [Acidobacteria bacterium]|nr:SPOR domain-containing protein [Acidobacteriota bacterium]
MKVICPKCQFENQADSSRVVCARCATIIEVKQDLGTGPEGNGKRQTARLPFVGNVGNSQPLNNPLPNPPANAGRDVYATRIGDDFDDVLDIPRQTQPTYQAGQMNQPSNEPTTAFEDVFAMPNYDSPPSYDLPPQPERKPTAPMEGFPTGPNRQRATQDYDESPEPEFMGWPVLPENADYEPDQSGTMASNRGALLIRIGLGVLVFGLLSVAAYFLLGDKIAKRQAEFNDRVASGNTETSASSTYPPATVPSIESKPPAASPSTEPVKPQDQAPAVSNNAKPIEIQPATGKTGHSPSPKPAPQTEQSVAATPNNGSLTIQVASFNDQAQANERVNSLRSKGVEARAVRVEIPNKGTWYRVQIGGFKSREEASGYANQLRSKGILQDFIITTVGK